MNVTFLLLIFATGAAGIAAQILLLRELLVSFNGNELTIGIILSNWMIAEALGVFLGGVIVSSLRGMSEANDEAIPKFRDCFVAKNAPRNDIVCFVGAQVVFFLALFFALYLSRAFKSLLGIGFGEAIGLGAVIFSFLIILAPALIHGALFSLGCGIYAHLKSGITRSIGRVYAWETFGTLAGGLGLTYFFIPWLDPFGAAFVLSVFVFLICLALILRMRLRRIYFVTASLLFLCYVFIGPAAATRLKEDSLLKQWKGYKLLDSYNTIYGSISVTEQPGQYTFYYDGLPQVSAPHPDRQFVGDFGNLPLLFHPGPKEILVIGSGAGGLLREILNHDVSRVDYAELDPAVIREIKKYPTELTAGELADKRLRLVYSDGRYFIRSSARKYDLILVGLSAPADLSANRLFTAEFYALAGQRLNKGGIIAFWLPRQEAYMGREQALANAAILAALGKSFPFTRIIPGDYYAIYLGSNLIDIKGVTTLILKDRLHAQGIDSPFLSSAYLDYLFSPERENVFLNRLPRTAAFINSDRRPIAVFDMFLFQSKKFFQVPSWMVSLMERLSPFSLCLLALIPFMLLPAVFSRRRGRRFPVFYSLMTTGFFGMLSSLSLIFAFQAWYGYVFYALSLFIAVFMAGAGIGGVIVTENLRRLKRPDVLFVVLEWAIMAFCLLLGYFFTKEAMFNAALLFFAVLFFLSGFLVGMQFPLAAALFSRDHAGAGFKPVPAEAGGVSAILYSADLAGGWIAGALGGMILLPVAGLPNTCLLMAFLKLSSLLWFVSKKYKK